MTPHWRQYAWVLMDFCLGEISEVALRELASALAIPPEDVDEDIARYRLSAEHGPRE